MNKAEQRRSQYLMIAKDLPYRMYSMHEVAYLLRISTETFKRRFRYQVISPMKSKWGKEYYTDEDIKKAYRYMFGDKYIFGIASRNDKRNITQNVEQDAARRAATRTQGDKDGQDKGKDEGDADGGGGGGLPPEEGTSDS